MIKQRTLKTTVRATGVGLHTGHKVAMALRPAPVDTGIVFCRSDLPGMPAIPARALNVRDWSGNDPVRLVIDRNLKLPKNLKLFDGSQETLCYNLIKDSREGKVGFVKLSATSFLQELLSDLHARQIQSLLIEGGAGILRAFMDAGLWDEARVFVSVRSFENGIAAPQLPGVPAFREQVSSDVLHYYFAS